MTKTQREEWDEWVAEAHSVKDTINGNSLDDVMVAMDVYVRKLERELQALKNKKTMAALLMKKA